MRGSIVDVQELSLLFSTQDAPEKRAEVARPTRGERLEGPWAGMVFECFG